MSEALFLVNPRKKRRKSRKGRMPAGLRRYWASKRRGAKVTKRRRKRRSATSLVPRGKRRKNPHRSYRRHARRRNPMRARRHHRKHHRRSNPFSMRGISHTIMPAAVGATGAIALDVAYAYAGRFLPAQLQSGFMPVLVKAAGAIGLGMLARRVVSREKANAATLGALTVVAYGAIKPLIAQFAPTIPGLSGYADFVNYGTSMSGMGSYMQNFRSSQTPDTLRGLGFYSPAPTIGSRAGESAYTGIGAYLPGQMQGYDVPSWQSDGM